VSSETVKPEIVKTEDEWKAELDPDRYHVLREKGTEPAWTGTLLDVHDPGLFRCAACGAELFRSDDKFDSGSGWPSFTKAAAEGVINEHDDSSFGMRRTEVTCAKCGNMIQAPNHVAGRTLRCFKCLTPFTVPKMAGAPMAQK